VVAVKADRALLKKAPGLDPVEEPENQRFPMPLFTSEKYNCEVGRLRLDCALDNGLCFWVCGDQLLKGAALNAVQIAEELVK
jgi:aspartate-semialdehyde dehydrogenase